MTDFLDDKRREISERLRELKPAVDESNRLEAAAAALAGVRGSSSASATPRRRGPGRPYLCLGVYRHFGVRRRYIQNLFPSKSLNTAYLPPPQGASVSSMSNSTRGSSALVSNLT